MDFGGHCQPIRRRLHAAKSRIVAGQFVVPVVQPLKKQVNTMSKIRDHDNRTDSRQAVGYRCAAWNSGFSVSPKRTRVPDRQHCISRLTIRLVKSENFYALRSRRKSDEVCIWSTSRFGVAFWVLSRGR